MSGGSQFSSEVPKGDAWGVETALERAAIEFENTGHSPMIPVIGILGIKAIKLISGDDGPTRQVVAKLFRIDALTTPKAIREGQKLIMKALADRVGQGHSPVLPFEQDDILRMAFGGVNVDEIEQDEKEKIEDENIDDPERLRRHLTAVHNVPADEVAQMEWVDIRTRHDSDHDRPQEDGLPPHAPDSWIWRRVDLEAAESEADGATDADDVSQQAAGEPAPIVADHDDDSNVTPLFRTGTDDAEEDQG